MRRVTMAGFAVLLGWAVATTTVLAVGDKQKKDPFFQKVDDMEAAIKRFEAGQSRLEKSVPTKGGVLRVQGIEVVNSEGQVVFKVGAASDGAYVKVYNVSDKVGLALAAGKNGGLITLLDGKGKVKRNID